jgi:hypothetical protein
MSDTSAVFVGLPQPGSDLGPTDFHTDPDCVMMRRWDSRWRNAGQPFTYVATTRKGLPANCRPALCCAAN